MISCKDIIARNELRYESHKRRGNHRKDSEASLEAPLASMHGQNSSSAREIQEYKDTPVTGTGQGGRLPEGAAESLQGPTSVPEKRCNRDALRVAFVADKEVVKEHAQ